MQISRRTFVVAVVAGALSGRTLLGADHKKDEKDKGEWEKLGERKVGKKEERDVIEVSSTHGYTALSFRVEDANIEIEDIKVTFADDETYSAKEKLVFR